MAKRVVIGTATAGGAGAGLGSAAVPMTFITQPVSLRLVGHSNQKPAVMLPRTPVGMAARVVVVLLGRLVVDVSLAKFWWNWVLRFLVLAAP